jgi:hypothetical protein
MEARFSFTNNNKSANKGQALEEKSAILDNVLLLCFVELTE